MARAVKRKWGKTVNGKRVTGESKRWYAEYVDADGLRKRVRGFTDRAATEQLAARLERESAREAEGLGDPARHHRRRPLADHLDEYAAALSAKGDTPEHVRRTLAKVRAIFDGCAFAGISDADPARVSAWLTSLRKPKQPVKVPAGEEFTPRAAAPLLGISLDALRAAVERNKLVATGHGKGRRLPRSTVEALVLKAAEGASPQTVNHYVRAVRGFMRWLVRTKRLASDPLESLPLLNTSTDVRRGRRELSADEMTRLLGAARQTTRSLRGLAGAARYHLSLAAATTGLRAGALANLSPADFDLGELTVTLPARFNKSRKPRVQPLPAETAAELSGYLQGKPK